MSFQQFYGLKKRHLRPSRLATIPEEKYRSSPTHKSSESDLARRLAADRARAAEAGFGHRFVKPVDIAGLAACIAATSKSE